MTASDTQGEPFSALAKFRPNENWQPKTTESPRSRQHSPLIEVSRLADLGMKPFNLALAIGGAIAVAGVEGPRRLIEQLHLRITVECGPGLGY